MARGRAPRGLKGFLRARRPAVATQHYVSAFGKAVRLPRPIARGLQRIGAGRLLRQRNLVLVDNQRLPQLNKATARGYLEVVVPANKGHVYFRHGAEVFDFYPGGLRVGGVRPIRSERYGFLIPLRRGEERRLRSYLARLKKTEGAELGPYDFHGDKGFHCVSWLMRAALGAERRGERAGRNLVALLGGRPRDGGSMPRFARFLLARAKRVEAVVVYRDGSAAKAPLARTRLQLISSRALRRAFEAQ